MLTLVQSPSHVADHFTMIFDPAVYGLVLASLENGGPINPTTQFDKTYCTYLSRTISLRENTIPKLIFGAAEDNVVIENPDYLASLVGALVALAQANSTKLDAEPTLQVNTNKAWCLNLH